MSVAFDESMSQILPMVPRVLGIHTARPHDVQRRHVKDRVGVPRLLGVDNAHVRSGWIPFRIV